MKVTFEGATVDEIQQLLTLSQLQSGSVLTKEQFMSTMKDVTDQLTLDKDQVIAYIAKRDQGVADLQAALKDSAAKIVTDEAELADLHAQIDSAFAQAKAIGDAVNPPPVVVPAPVDTGAAPADGTAAAPAPSSADGSAPTSGSGSTDGSAAGDAGATPAAQPAP